MTSVCAHRIDVTNLSDNEVVNHSLLLVKGRIHGRCTNGTTSPVTVDLQVLQRAKQHRDLGQLQTQVSPRDGEFKLLLDLRRAVQPDVNVDEGEVTVTFRFRHCNAERVLPIAYRQAERRRDHHLQALYIICRGEECGRTSAALELIDLNLQLVQCVYADKLRAAGFGRRTFALSGRCRPFYTQLSCAEAWQLGEDALWQCFAQEILESSDWGAAAGEERLKFVAFIACTKYDGATVAASGDHSYANIRNHLSAHAALGGGGLALFGSAYFYSWPRHFNEIIDCFRCERKVDVSVEPDDSNYRRTWGGVYATTLGAICHELGHTFDLGHTEDGVMGAGFDFLNRVFTVDNLTENLPTRIIQKSVLETPQTTQRSRFTQLRRSTRDTFLDKYHAQKENDAFYFPRNCAVILAHHKWLRDSSTNVAPFRHADLKFDAAAGVVVCETAPLRLIELRCRENSIVTHYYEFEVDVEKAAVHRFQLPAATRNLSLSTHYVFALTTCGQTKRFDTNASDDNKQ